MTGGALRNSEQASPTPAPARRSIVCIESDPAEIALMNDVLADFEDVELLIATTAELGIDIARTRRPNLVIMELHLDGMDGFEATERLRAWPETRETPVIALNSDATAAEKARAKRAGFYRYFEKPLKIDALLAAIEPLFAPMTKLE